jgi:hypothetical protein
MQTLGGVGDETQGASWIPWTYRMCCPRDPEKRLREKKGREEGKTGR